MVSSSKPTQRVHRSTAKYSHMATVSPKKDSGTWMETLSPPAAISCKQVST